jgi:WD40 repeat protein
MKFNKAKAWSFILLSMYLYSAEAPNATKIYSKGGKGVYKKASGEKEVVIYETKKDYIRERGVSVSPNGKYVAAIETTRGVTPPGEHDYSVLPKNFLVFIDVDGKEITRLDEDVRKYSWSPDGNEIAYITGTYSEDGDIGFKTTGLHIFSLEDGNKKEVAPKAYYVNWVSFDSCIYFSDLRKVFKYDPVTAKTEETPYYGINFSPDGEYYTTSSTEEPYQVYSTKTNQPVTERLLARFKHWTYLPSWNLDYEHHLEIVEIDYIVHPDDVGKPIYRTEGIKQKKYAIYDVEKDQIIKEWVEKPEE